MFGVVLLVVGLFVVLPVDLRQLKEWQTLLVALIPLVAAAIAYQGDT
jgi:hypothetical protein